MAAMIEAFTVFMAAGLGLVAAVVGTIWMLTSMAKLTARTVSSMVSSPARPTAPPIAVPTASASNVVAFARPNRAAAAQRPAEAVRRAA